MINDTTRNRQLATRRSHPDVALLHRRTAGRSSFPWTGRNCSAWSTPPFGGRTVAYLVTDQPHNFTLVGQEALPIVRTGDKDNLQLPKQRGMADGADAGGGTLGEALLAELGFRDELVGIPVDDPSWGSGLLRWVAVEGEPGTDRDGKAP
jgi:hypothetical protein